MYITVGNGDNWQRVHERLVRTINISPDSFVPRLLAAGRDVGLCLLDSCNNRHPDSHLLIAGLFPAGTLEFSNRDIVDSLQLINQVLTGDRAAFFSLSYEFGRKLQAIETRNVEHSDEPDVFVSLFDALLVHDYSSGKTFLTGNADRFDTIEYLINRETVAYETVECSSGAVHSNFTRSEYLQAIEAIKEEIRRGNTYQTNLTQRLTVELSKNVSLGQVFQRIRDEYPVPFAAFLERKDSTVVSASPERFLKVVDDRIFVSPIKGTRPRGKNELEDLRLKNELLHSEKDRAENTMIADLLRNDLGRICEFGSIRVNELCALQELPTLFHLVSTIEGKLKTDVVIAKIIEAVFPCGSITGAPKLRTMKIINEIEGTSRGLSMGAIGLYVPERGFDLPAMLDLSVAIRTMVIRRNIATFNVGGGIVIDSEPEMEYEESLLKAQALLNALGIKGEINLN